MYPFSALPALALRHDMPHSNGFGVLPLDTLSIVIRSIAHEDRASLLNLALANKSAYFATRRRREWLALIAEDGGAKWNSTQIQNDRRFQHALCVLGQSDMTIPADAVQALLSHCMDKIFFRRNLMLSSDWALSMLEQLSQAACSPPIREQSDLPWKLLLAQDRAVAQQGHARDALLSAVEKAGDSLPDEERDGFAFACRIARWRYGSGRTLTATNLKEACDRCLLAPATWALDVLALMLDVIASHLDRLPLQQRGELASDMLKATAAWPALQRSRILERLLEMFCSFGVDRNVAEALVERMAELEHMLEELPSLADDDKLILLHRLVCLIQKGRTLCGHCGDEQAATAALDGIASRVGEQIIGHLLALPCSRDPHSRMGAALKSAMQVCYGWNTDASQWQAGFDAICAANRRLHGVGYGVLRAAFGHILFKHRDHNQVQARQLALGPLLKTGPKAVGSDKEIATWSLFISVIENSFHGLNYYPRDVDEHTALRNAHALLAEPDIMTPAAWVEMMCLTLAQIETPDKARRIILQALPCAAAFPDGLRVKMLKQIASMITSWEPAYQSGVADSLLPMVGALAEHEKADLLPGLVTLYLNAFPRNSAASLWLPEIMRLFASLPDPLKTRALETTFDEIATQADPHACAALLPELERQIGTLQARLQARPQACLLLSLALCLNRVGHSQGQRMLADMMARLDSLDLPQEEKTAWQLLYQAAHPSSWSGNTRKALLPDVDCHALPEPLRQATQTMLDYIGKLPRYARREAKPAANDRGCVIA